ncbi:hypothetical protein ACEQ8H_000523 [Pleosporales sp. CAS-2024a]
MLNLIVFGLIAVAQSAPSKHHKKPKVKENKTVDPQTDFARELAVAKQWSQTVTGPADVVANWTNSGDNICYWEGFYCETNPFTNEYVLASIDFNSKHLEGAPTVSNLVENFPDVALFHANSNNFTGDIPDMSQLKYMYEFDISNNNFSGPWPRNLLTVPAFTYLDMRYNNFNGPIPAESLISFPNMTDYYLNNNQFSGNIPDTIVQTPVQNLMLFNNQLTGWIPWGLGKNKNIQQLSFSNNQLTGPIPWGLGGMTSLIYLDLSNNKLWGMVPDDLCGAPNLKQADLSGNWLAPWLGPKCQKMKNEGRLWV